ncbi:conserved hypothetical protein [Xenorhabdus bovienii str. puntauvense]|uniref:Uncharacterized protein n=1 Tax=Xenorhabdus bovienii str. puntauvense TaxID=1398201 RepID=A0A077ND78_XENBV|nr:hypothetical protein [Xenorhabdus bovienii]CDG96849.1 conserved hypothetical protein [Xenorhabdus bovienii str. puntauvense]
MYKVSLQAQGKFNTQDYRNKTALLLISVGKSYHEGFKLAATIDKINQSGFGRCIIVVADTLQRHNYDGGKAQHNYAKSLALGDYWLRQNNEIIATLAIPYEIQRWDEWLRHESYRYYYDNIVNTYYTNDYYRQAVNETIRSFSERNSLITGTIEYENSFYRSLFYILEECPVIMPMWAEHGIHFIIYPRPMTSAMSKTRELFVKEQSNNYVNWLSLKFKKIRSVDNNERIS